MNDEASSVNYNEKFKSLSNKISKIAQETKSNAMLANRYLNRLNDIEEKGQRRINNLDKSFSSLKEQYMKLTSQYETNSQNYKNKGISSQIKASTNKIESQLQSQRDNMKEYIDSIMQTVENGLEKKKSIQSVDKQNFIKEVEDIGKVIDSCSHEIEEKNSNEKEKINKIVNDIAEDSNNEFGNVYELIKTEQTIKEDNKKEFDNNIKELMTKINEEFKNEEKKREDFEKNIFDLIEDTVVKLSEDN